MVDFLTIATTVAKQVHRKLEVQIPIFITLLSRWRNRSDRENRYQLSTLNSQLSKKGAGTNAHLGS